MKKKIEKKEERKTEKTEEKVKFNLHSSNSLEIPKPETWNIKPITTVNHLSAGESVNELNRAISKREIFE